MRKESKLISEGFNDALLVGGGATSVKSSEYYEDEDLSNNEYIA